MAKVKSAKSAKVVDERGFVGGPLTDTEIARVLRWCVVGDPIHGRPHEYKPWSTGLFGETKGRRMLYCSRCGDAKWLDQPEGEE